jgi:glycosyltransferase involved in cell wall biosynthesis
MSFVFVECSAKKREGFVNIGIVTAWFESGDGYLSRQYREALACRCQVFVYGRGRDRRPLGDPEWDREFVTWDALPMADEPSAVNLDHFDSWLQQRGLDAVFFIEQYWWEPVLLCERRNVLTGTTMLHYTQRTIPLYDCYDFLICNTRHHYEVFQEHPQVLFLPYGTDVRRFHPSTSDLVRPGSVTFFHSAGMNPYRKGTELVLEAAARLRPGAASPRLVVHINPLYLPHLEARESGVDQLLQRRLESLQRSGQAEVITQAVKDVADLYRLGDVCLYPTRHEGLGLGVAEALASGLPVIVTDASPVNEHADGRLVRPVRVRRYYARIDGDFWPAALVDVEALAAAMQEFLDHPDQLPGLKRQARELAEQKLDWKANASGLPEFFTSVQKVRTARKEGALKLAREFEAERTELNLRKWAGARHPWMISAGRRLKSLLKLRTQQVRGSRAAQGH